MPEVVSRTLRISAPPDSIDTVQDLLATVWAQTPDLDPADLMAAELSIVELAANVIEHANRGEAISFTLSVVVYDDRIEATVTDEGRVDVVDLSARSMPEQYAERGRGIPLMQALTETVEHTHVDGVNYWTVVRARRRRGSTPRRKGMPSISIAGVIDEMARQRALDDMGLLDTPPEERFDRVARLAVQLFGVETAAINLIDHDRQWSKSVVGKGPQQMPRDASLCTVTITSDSTLIVPDIGVDHDLGDKMQPDLLQFYAGHPLYAPGGERIGAFCIYDSRPRRFSEREADMLRDLASWVQQEVTVSQELSRASAVQQGLLPQQMLSMPGWSIAGVFVTAFHARLDMDSGELSYVDAGHGLAIVARADGGSQRLTSSSPPLGVDPEAEWPTQSITLDPGDTLVVVSDGVLDLYDGTLASLDNLVALAMLAQDPWEIIDAIRARARGFSADDVTMLVVRRDG